MTRLGREACDPELDAKRKGIIEGEITRYNEAIDGLINFKDRINNYLIKLRGSVPVAEELNEVSDAGSGTIGELRRSTQRFEHVLGEIESMIKELETY